ncbi:MAG: T9SS type A sorting domain-containing protein [DPANN group archaeon]|nr:T9SS type A sorting domain-containing protein [DPANN group archaeon]
MRSDLVRIISNSWFGRTLKIIGFSTVSLIFSSRLNAQTPPSEYWGLVNNGDIADSTLVETWIDINGNGQLNTSGANTPTGSEIFDVSYTIQGYYNTLVNADVDTTDVVEGGSPVDSMTVRIGGYDATPKLEWIAGSNTRQDLSVETVSIWPWTDSSMPITYTLSQNYPNPFNSSTTIDFSVPYNSYINLSIFNVRGRIVETLVDKKIGRGNYVLLWTPKKNLPTGPYFYRIEVDGRAITKRMTLLK